MSRAMYWSEVALVAAIGAIAIVVFLWALYCAIWAWMERRIEWHNRRARLRPLYDFDYAVGQDVKALVVDERVFKPELPAMLRKQAG